MSVENTIGFIEALSKLGKVTSILPRSGELHLTFKGADLIVPESVVEGDAKAHAAYLKQFTKKETE